jgi:hypothetical protein
MSKDTYAHKYSTLKVASHNGHRSLQKIEIHSNVAKIGYGVCTLFHEEKLTCVCLPVCV